VHLGEINAKVISLILSKFLFAGGEWMKSPIPQLCWGE